MRAEVTLQIHSPKITAPRLVGTSRSCHATAVFFHTALKGGGDSGSHLQAAHQSPQPPGRRAEQGQCMAAGSGRERQGTVKCNHSQASGHRGHHVLRTQALGAKLRVRQDVRKQHLSDTTVHYLPVFREVSLHIFLTVTLSKIQVLPERRGVKSLSLRRCAHELLNQCLFSYQKATTNLIY